MIPIYYGWCGCTVWPLALGERVGRCGRCGRKPVYMMGEDRKLSRENLEALIAH